MDDGEGAGLGWCWSVLVCACVGRGGVMVGETEVLHLEWVTGGEGGGQGPVRTALPSAMG